MSLPGRLCRSLVLPVLERSRPAGRLAVLRRYEASQWLSRQQVQDQARARLREMLLHAAGTTAYYGRMFREAGLDPAGAAPEETLPSLPVLRRQDVRAHFDALTSDAVPPSERHRNATGGSTGEPLTLLQDTARDEANMADRYRTQRWAGWDLGERSLTLWGAPTDLARKKGLKARLRNAVLIRDLALDAWQLSPETLAGYTRALQRWRPRLVSGYASALALFARHLLSRGVRVEGVAGVISSAETLFPQDRAAIEEAFSAQVFNRYATRDVGGIAHECQQHDGMHINADGVIVEVVDASGRPCPGEEGEILITTLTNRAMPLIRYAIGDRGKLLDRACPCGRGLPMMRLSGGRISDVLRFPSGRVLSGVLFPHLFKDHREVVMGQVVQVEPAKLRIRIVLEPGADLERVGGLRHGLEDLIGGDASLEFEVVERIEPGPTGKYRFVIPYTPPS